MKEDKHVRQLIATLNDEGWPVRQAAAKALGELRAGLAVAQLIEALGDEDAWVRWSAATALGRIDDARAVKPLVESLEDENWRVRKASAEALGEMSGHQLGKAIGALKAAGFAEQARKLRFKQLSQAFKTAEIVKRDLAIINQRREEGTAGQVEQALLEDHARRLEEALVVAQDSGDAKIFRELNHLIEAIGKLRPIQQTTITDSLINRSMLAADVNDSDDGKRHGDADANFKTNTSTDDQVAAKANGRVAAKVKGQVAAKVKGQVAAKVKGQAAGQTNEQVEPGDVGGNHGNGVNGQGKAAPASRARPRRHKTRVIPSRPAKALGHDDELGVSHTDPLDPSDASGEPWEAKVSGFLELMQALKELVEMKEKGLLSEDEFTAAKAKLL